MEKAKNQEDSFKEKDKKSEGSLRFWEQKDMILDEKLKVKNIAILSDELINLIAAGEVIESPSSVIKELVENSLDAGSSKIQIEIKGSGLLLIRISDDGHGMSPENLKLAMLRHATSKIRSLNDLQKVTTMGFRGEALSSIAAISKMKIESAFAEEGAFIDNEKFEIQPSPRKRGTLVEVRSLFYNVPVRKKFQKSLGGLTAEIIKVVHSLALANPFVGFSLTMADKTILDVKGAKDDFEKALTSRVKDILGEKTLESLIYVDAFDLPLKIRGFISQPNFTRLNKRAQYLSVNNRSVFSYLVSEAIKEGYGTALAENAQSVFVLHITAHPDLIDVNVHPQKRQIRFCEEEFIRERLHKMVEKTFEKDARIVLNPPLFQKEAVFSKENSFSFESFHEVDLFSGQKTENIFKEITLLNEYFIFELLSFDGKNLFALDLKAASSLLFFENAIKAFQKNEPPALQSLSFPIMLDLLKEETALLGGFLDDLSLLGLDIRIIGEKTIAIDGISEYLENENVKELILSILEEIELFGKTEKKRFVLEKKLAYRICRLVKSRKKSYKMEEARAIAEKILHNSSSFDPLGEPILIEIAPSDLAKLFSNKKGAPCLTPKE